MAVLPVVLALVAAQRLAELVLAARNTRALLARGGREVGAAHYPLFIVLHGAWLAALALLVPWDTPPSWPLLGLLVVLQLGRAWVIASLGPFWTTRIITLDGAPLVRRGPYRLVRHPNYLVVSAEIVTLPLAFGAGWIAVAFAALNAVLVAWRISVEEAALAPRSARPGTMAGSAGP
ncbi:isoprenylcysteine carboxyl methyltransferase family protein [Zavarzinia sp. CC-PAN008]|uniref:isoprenylcysteine carboxyl methyltransferase family protein n=1 Tax=Zavarzinia sp. CC-PAN008 TaxID=3243332 RepID=UPI003F746004